MKYEKILCIHHLDSLFKILLPGMLWPPILALKKIIIALFLPVVAVFSFMPESTLPSVAAIDGMILPPPATPPASEVPPPAPPPTGGASPSSPPTDPTDELKLIALKDCLNRAGESGKCLDGIFREFLKTHTAIQALAAIQKYEDADTGLRLSCHPVVHAIGREAFRLKGTVQGAFTACDQTCHSGCYHGAMERFLRGNAAGDDDAGHISLEELREKAKTACDTNEPTRFRFQCLHGLGHALMFFSDYRLTEALASCDVLADNWSRSSCYGGLFMENVFSATPEKRDLSPTDYHYPCNSLAAKYRSDCYMMQTTRMSEMGLNTAQLFDECRKAEGYQHTCIQSIGRDLSNDARIGDPKLVAKKCELGTDEERRACTRGVAYALLDNTWDGRYAFPFCASFESGDNLNYCFGISQAYLQSTFAKTRNEMANDCRKYAGSSVLCTEVIR